MSINPNSNIYLVHTNLLNDYKHSLTFANKSAQTTYFTGLERKPYSEYTYIREDEAIVVEGNIDNLRKYNYLYYTNTGSSTKTYYCFITKMEWLSENSTKLFIETDVIQTYYFDITYKRSFVEREHVSNDKIGAHTIPEGLETGEYICTQECEKALDNPKDFYICFATTEPPVNTLVGVATSYNGLFSGLRYYAFKTAKDARDAIYLYDVNNKHDAIVSIFMIPKTTYSVINGLEETWSDTHGSAKVIELAVSTESDNIGNLVGTIPNNLNNYKPKNNKLFTYPYSFMNLTNNAGATIEFRYEDFIENEELHKIIATFEIQGSINAGMSIKAIPLGYKNLGLNYNYGLVLGKLPVCSWTSDTYVNWLTQNGLNPFIDIASNVVKTGASAATANVGGVVEGAIGIYNSVRSVDLAKSTPDQAKGNINSGDLNFSYPEDGGLTLYYMSIKKEYAQIIDNYFTWFGYKINEFKVPQFTSRKYWNYIKTIECNITGNIPQEFIEVIKGIFNKGITFWHDATKFLDYSQNNTII